MSTFTYEHEEQSNALETFEWDNTWFEQTGRRDIPRVLYIGDSISCATRRIATAHANSRFLFDGFGTSKALDNPFLFESIRLFAAQQDRCDAVIFNNGLHGWHLDDTDAYRHYYERAVQFLTSEFKGIPVFVVLTTSVENEQREQRVIARNEIAKAVAAKYGLPVIDLYAISREYASLRDADGVHFSHDGYEKFADRIIADLSATL